ncbi:RNA-binding domain-containing protein [Rhizoclosmatium globosum]|uniref:RNA-binding domain-containing protein n=1 Tax=Rhizoclosmatium globosum TaxID=329046 RepID=A0A1Y2A974_9FUNG|nr:RNA-binding domain-containing protein [Rhizoclosmatium globosum]|eukprot:ORY19082.1 RNA-binding domain-containing protein [Rhizoclosmatium globosum]
MEQTEGPCCYTVSNDSEMTNYFDQTERVDSKDHVYFCGYPNMTRGNLGGLLIHAGAAPLSMEVFSGGTLALYKSVEEANAAASALDGLCVCTRAPDQTSVVSAVAVSELDGHRCQGLTWADKVKSLNAQARKDAEKIEHLTGMVRYLDGEKLFQSSLEYLRTDGMDTMKIVLSESLNIYLPDTDESSDIPTASPINAATKANNQPQHPKEFQLQTYAPDQQQSATLDTPQHGIGNIVGCQLFVGNLPFTFQEQALKDLFSQDGRTVLHANIAMDSQGRSRGYGQILMSTMEEAQDTIAKLNKTHVSGRQIEVSEFKSVKEEEKPGQNLQ